MRYGKKVANDKLIQHHRFTIRKHLGHKNDTNEKHKMHFCFFALNKTALARNVIHLSVMLKKVSFSKNTHLDMGVNFSMHIVQHGRWHTGTSICNTVSKFWQCWLSDCIHSLLDVSPQKKVQWVQVRWMWRPFYATTISDDLLLECIQKILLDTWYPMQRGAIMLKP